MTRRAATGKQSKADSRREKAKNSKTAPPTASRDGRQLSGDFLNESPSPPIEEGVAKVEEWAADLNLRMVASIETATADKLRVLSRCVQLLGKLRQKAERSEDAVKARNLRLKDRRTLGDDPPFGDPAAMPAWCYRQIALLAHAVATGKSRGRLVEPKLKLLAQQGFVPCNAALEEVSQAIEALSR